MGSDESKNLPDNSKPLDNPADMSQASHKSGKSTGSKGSKKVKFEGDENGS